MPARPRHCMERSSRGSDDDVEAHDPLPSGGKGASPVPSQETGPGRARRMPLEGGARGRFSGEGRVRASGVGQLPPFYPIPLGRTGFVFSGSSPARALRVRAFVIACLSAAAARGAPVVAQGAPLRGASAPITVRDDAGRTVVLPRPARRIVSLIPSATETLVAIGARDAVVGRTRYDTATAVRGATDVGGGLDPDLERLRALRPDLVLVWASPSQTGLPAQLARLGIPTFGIAVDDTAGVFRAHASLGRLTGREREATVQANRLRAQLAAVAADPVAGAPRVLYLLFGDPPLSVGRTSYIHEVLALAGARNVFADQTLPFPQVSVEAILARDPDAIVLPVGTDGARIEARMTALRSTAGYRELRAVRTGRVVRIDADLMNRPGPALGIAVAAVRDSLRRVLGGR